MRGCRQNRRQPLEKRQYESSFIALIAVNIHLTYGGVEAEQDNNSVVVFFVVHLSSTQV